MHTLYLARHAEAFHPAENPTQSLNDLGKRHAFEMAAFLKQAGVNVSRTFHSQKPRSLETAEILTNALSTSPSLEYLPELDPDVDPERLGQKIISFPSQTLIVGHLPNLELLSYFLLIGNFNQAALSFVPGAVACFKQEGQAWLLEWFVSPAFTTQPFAKSG